MAHLAPPMIPIAIMVKNTLQNKPLQTYKTEVISGGILLGAMKRLNYSDAGFMWDNSISWNLSLLIYMQKFMLTQEF